MKMHCTTFIFGVILFKVSCGIQHYTDQWAIHLTGGERAAKDLALRHGFAYVSEIMPDYYVFQHRKVAKRSVYSSSSYHRTLAQESNVHWLEQQVVKKRVKRDIYFPHNYEFNDPKWSRMWYLSRGGGLDMNVRSAWEQGVTGKGVVVTILDDGIEKDHPDLQTNYDGQASYDVNNHDPDPQPRYDYTNENRHGTRCAGEVAAQADNHMCSFGVAYNAKIGGVRMLDGDVTDSVEATSLSLNQQHIQVYSASWGPDDDGRTVDGPATLARKAFFDGITKGRGGLGSIYVWASGNGGRDGDSCNCDGYTNSIYTLSISSATEYGNIPWYSEACSSTLATTYSSGSGGEKQIVTTDLRKTCTETHTGTSASAPLAAGLVALALEANPGLTWRDMQHIVVHTAKKANLKADDWIVNGVNRSVSHSFGYGLMDAGGMVRLARNWTKVPPQHICEIRSRDVDKPIPMNGKITVYLDTDGCEGVLDHVKYLEHVQARITLTASRRGEIQIFLISPMGTRSTLLARRAHDNSREGFNNWAFMTTHSWGETAKGTWILEIENGASSFRGAKLKDWVLVLYGTKQHPQEPTKSRTKKNNDYNPYTQNYYDNPVYPKSQVHKQPYNYNPERNYDPYRTRYQHNYPNNNDPYDQRFYQRKPTTTSSTTSTTTTTTTTTTEAPFLAKSSNINRHVYPNSHYNDPFFQNHNFPSKDHMCIFETLAKKKNMSAQQYMRMVRENMTPAQLKQWSLVMRGTLTHPQKKNDSTPSYMPIQQPFKCAGITNNGVCIECKPGFYRYGEGCVPNCPDHYYGEMETVLVGNGGNTSSKSSSYNRHGVCKKCNAACKTCKGPYVTDCYQCSNGYEVRDGQCHKKPLMNFLDPDMLSFFVWVIILCTSLILLFGVVFIVLQARDHRILCWKEKRHYDDSKGKYNGITVNLSAGQESDSEHIEHVLQNRHTNNLNTCNIYHNNYTHQHA
ncbi:furin-like protease kpc-1 isoform X3 [Mytilus californianus]|uniref:furin-like protease kpc-1 isoform X3 n=1 Tax=Mytilus californianus TaxID=6549 RepID=UPI002245FEFE|nr:furin-like protease kpc-1 isoform X3 [Mytilus californianus]